MRTRDEDKCLGYNSNLEVDDHVQLEVVVVDGLTLRRIEGYSKLILEEGGVDDDRYKRDTGSDNVNNSTGKIGYGHSR